MAQLTLEQAIGQLFMVGIDGTTVDETFVSLVRGWKVGNVVLFARNLTDGAQAERLTKSIQECVMGETGLPALISADQEGGIVLRLVTGATPFPGNMAIGATGQPERAYQVARAIGTELLHLGINMNLAPVLDINNNPKNPVIGVRSFGTTAHVVTQFGEASVRGYRDSGVLAVAKHFPGHGDTALDSHTSLPVISRTLDELIERELAPFRAAVRAGLPGIMTAHIAFPKIDTLPATLSQKVLTGVLREQMHFDGLILTDSMRMRGITGQFGPGEAAVMALQAGCDLLLYSAMGAVETEAIRAVRSAVARGELSEARIRQSAARIVAAKQGLANGQPFSADEHRHLALTVSREAVTVVRDRNELLPLNPTEQTLFIEVTRRPVTQVEEQVTLDGIRTQMGSFLPNAEHLAVSLDPDEREIAAVAERARSTRLVMITQDAWRYPGQERLLRVLAKSHPDRLVLVAGRLPYDVDLVPEVSTAICTYNLVPSAVRALLEVLTGTRS